MITNMRKFTIFLILFFLFLVFPTSKSLAEEKINSFESKIIINQDSSIFVEEKISYDFGTEERHGTFRDIPTKYDTNVGKRSIKLDILGVERDGVSEPYDYSGDRIKIGDANKTINGSHEYLIQYSVLGAINYFDDFDELYWNVTGNSWPVMIENAKASVILTSEIPKENLKAGCYQGIFGSNESCITSFDKDNIIFSSTRNLNQGEGLTLAIGFPKGLIIPISGSQKTWWWLRDNYIAFLPVIVFILLYMRWRKYGKDPIGRGTIIAEYEPPRDVLPTMVGSLVDEKVDNRDISAGLIYLAEQGFAKIKKIEKSGFLGFKSSDYELELLKDIGSCTTKTERTILEMFFGQGANKGKIKNISEFKNNRSFVAEVEALKSSLYQDMTDRGFFVQNPQKAKVPYIILGIIILAVGFFIGVPIFGLIGILGFGLSGILFIIFGSLMSKKTPLGAETKDHILGFKIFLTVTEKDRLAFHNSPERTPEQFMKFLPYAIALSVENKWAKQFEGIYITASKGGSGSGGGGFSGGGMGGGGGGSW
ncbi:MAG: hypothetical protein US50_C0038G0014 [Candidatus Nomurabacteria bacterium GW2011_GWB1_37_5]|uniref:DUF2207 domain-containing protein n=1 Tax=Candidatus Nomurabacteria bacterium GW2011_GWB1_37_5 TaxID=1618742 RepID=A0A0G0JD89_9BACT|nr:MAG: hypothetical protein US50_C0038G0014 [Candidatus Nomurabacteria bacterium GW2011_GWB1_37_5]